METDAAAVGARLHELEAQVRERAADLAVFLVYDRPERVAERPGIQRAFFTERCASNEQLSSMIAEFRAIDAYVEVLEGELALLGALAEGRIQRMSQPLKLIYNGIEGGIASDGFQPGRKALIPAVADAYGVLASNSNAYACALGRHKFHYFTVLKGLGVPTPPCWHYRPGRGWAGERMPPAGLKVIVKSTYESWSVGVTDKSIFVVDNDCELRAATIAEEIGQPVTVQQFVAGVEVGVTVLACPELVVPPPVETVLAKAPGDKNAVMTVHDNLADASIVLPRYRGPETVLAALYQAAARAFDGLELEGFARIDLRVDDAEQVWVTDIGVSPGISGKDAAFRSLQEIGFDYGGFLRVVAGATLACHGVLG